MAFASLRGCAAALAALALTAALGAQAPPKPAAAPGSAPTPSVAAPRPISQIPAAKLAALTQLADQTFDYAAMRQAFLGDAHAQEASLLDTLKKKGLSAERAQAFVSAFERQLAARLPEVLNHDYIIQLMDAAYSDDQAAQLVAFYQTPLGRRVASLQPKIIEADTSRLQKSLAPLVAQVAHDVSGSFGELNADTTAPPPDELPRPAAVETNLYPPVAAAPADLAAAERRAAAHGHRVLVVFGADWCYDCHVLDAALRSPAYAPLMAGYELADINIGETGQDNLALARQLGVDIDKGVPALAVLDAQGKVLVAQKQGEFQDTRTLKSSALAAFLQTWQQH